MINLRIGYKYKVPKGKKYTRNNKILKLEIISI